MKRVFSLLSVLAVSLLWSCASPQTEYRVLRHSTFSHPYPTMRLYVSVDRDRSGGSYDEALDKLGLDAFHERIRMGLRQRRLSFETYTGAGSPTTVKLRNPFLIVPDSTQADLILHLRVDALEEGAVEVTRDRMLVWYGYGVAQVYELNSRVPRVLVALDAQLKEVSTGQIFYGFQANGIAVNRAHRREGIEVAMTRCERRFYEKLLKR